MDYHADHSPPVMAHDIDFSLSVSQLLLAWLLNSINRGLRLCSLVTDDRTAATFSRASVKIDGADIVALEKEDPVWNENQNSYPR